MPVNPKNILFFANTEWYLYNFRSALMASAREAGWGVRCVSPPGPFGEKLRAAGFEWDALPFERDSRLGMLLSLWRSRRVLRRLIAETRPATVFVTHAPAEAARLADRRMQLAGQPAVLVCE